jgi:hypothetical protein
VSGDLIRVKTSFFESFDYESVKATVDNHLAAG